MSALSVSPPFPIFTDVDGNPLEDGFIFIGAANQNPEVVPISVFWDAALTIPAAQPIRTLGGYPSRSGTPARMYVDADDFSLSVKNKNSTLIYSSLSDTTRIPFSLVSGNLGSDRIDYLPPGVAAVQTTVQSKLRQYINAKDFGAVGDGAADDSAALQLAIDYASSNGLALYVPSGTYLLSGLRKGPNAAIVYLRSNLTITGDGYQTVFKVADNYTDGGDYRVFSVEDSTAVNNVEISHIRMDGNGLNNLVLGSTGADIRRAYSINLLTGSNITIHDCWFENNPGRNVLSIGQNSAIVDFQEVRIFNNKFQDVGGAIVGNGLQNDHSSIYLQTTRGLVHGNLFTNTVQPNPFTSPTKAVVALEIHGTNTTMSNNTVFNYTGGGNLVAQISNSENNAWLNNKFLGMTSNILSIWSTGTFTNKRLTIRGNTLEIDNTTFNGANGILHGAASATAGTELEGLIIEDNEIYGARNTAQAITWHGISLCAINGASIRRNKIRNIQGNGINFEVADNALNIRNVTIEDNSFVDVGIHSAANRIWSVYIVNASTTRSFDNIKIRGNSVSRTTQAVGVAPFPCRGFNIIGGGSLSNIIIEDTTFNNILRTQRYTFTTPTNNVNVYVKPTMIASPRAADPVAGLFNNGQEIVIHNDPVATGFYGRVPTGSGSAVSGLWAATTVYNAGIWVRTSTNAILVCVTSGTSGGAEPAPSTLGIHLQDGTATWIYIDTAVAVFKTFGAISA